MKAVVKAWGVLMRCADGRQFLAHGEQAGAWMSSKFSEASAYAKELRAHLLKTTRVRVVSVTATYITEERKRRP